MNSDKSLTFSILSLCYLIIYYCFIGYFMLYDSSGFATAITMFLGGVPALISLINIILDIKDYKKIINPSKVQKIINTIEYIFIVLLIILILLDILV